MIDPGALMSEEYCQLNSICAFSQDSSLYFDFNILFGDSTADHTPSSPLGHLAGDLQVPEFDSELQDESVVTWTLDDSLGGDASETQNDQQAEVVSSESDGFSLHSDNSWTPSDSHAAGETTYALDDSSSGYAGGGTNWSSDHSSTDSNWSSDHSYSDTSYSSSDDSSSSDCGGSDSSCD